ncbi:GGDEF domain-containing protein [Pseudomonas guariconensis]|uniref:GGDEF domain-containing protein n=1 Tax=Pseudomonas TaxID=286 RepID=UPI001CE42196|nr:MULTISPECIES: GGDEF domain-containing protein [Pseudomonas]MCO7642950.1 GGDEF domain-containing protein [Pseudomonas sp. S 311-6]MCO7513937.1 GGDEF domain-containing protein [Pseudomonas putida]MCO7567636.1 GGDEF domain-containing protein [Pseudomonas mosselii]MCO7597337.1 GGDEF domain-containing protein [Pseudomonas guariconensis]MCO7606093.1 GGDEF domain-containing protein [Pseudomonas guariconensis]
MFSTIEEHVRKQVAPAALRAEFRQREFEAMHRFCLLIFCVSIGVWLVFDLIVSYLGGQGFTWRSGLFIGLLCCLTVVLGFTRKSHHFDVLNLVFIAVITLAMRLVIEGIPIALRPVWLVLGVSTVLYSVSVLPVRGWSFFCAVAITWLLLNPFYHTRIELLELEGAMLLSYAVFLSGLVSYSYLRMRQAKLHNFYLSKVLLEQAYVDALTELPNRRAFMLRVERQLRLAAPGQFLAMIDIDNFKQVNDRFGHDIGDEVLKRVAGHIRVSMDGYAFARLGGEEFAIFFEGLDQQGAERQVAALCQRVREDLGGHPVTVSIGLTPVDSGDTLSMALVRADQALYQAKRSGKDRFVAFSKALRSGL